MCFSSFFEYFRRKLEEYEDKQIKKRVDEWNRVGKYEFEEAYLQAKLRAKRYVYIPPKEEELVVTYDYNSNSNTYGYQTDSDAARRQAALEESRRVERDNQIRRQAELDRARQEQQRQREQQQQEQRNLADQQQRERARQDDMRRAAANSYNRR